MPLPLLVTVMVVVVAAAAVAGVVVRCHVLDVLGSYWGGGAVGILLFPWPWHVAIPSLAFAA